MNLTCRVVNKTGCCVIIKILARNVHLFTVFFLHFLYVCNMFLFGKCEFINQISYSAAEMFTVNQECEKEAFSNENCLTISKKYFFLISNLKTSLW